MPFWLPPAPDPDGGEGGAGGRVVLWVRVDGLLRTVAAPPCRR